MNENIKYTYTDLPAPVAAEVEAATMRIIPMSAAPRREALSGMSLVLSLVESWLFKVAKLTDQLDERHLCRITFSIAEFEHTRVATRSVAVALGEIVEDLRGDMAIANDGERLTSGVQPAALAERNHLLGETAHFLGLGVGGLDALMVEQRCHHVSEHSFSMRTCALELS